MITAKKLIVFFSLKYFKWNVKWALNYILCFLIIISRVFMLHYFVVKKSFVLSALLLRNECFILFLFPRILLNLRRAKGTSCFEFDLGCGKKRLTGDFQFILLFLSHLFCSTYHHIKFQQYFLDDIYLLIDFWNIGFASFTYMN